MKLLLILLLLSSTALADGVNTVRHHHVAKHSVNHRRSKTRQPPQIKTSEEITSLLETPGDLPLELPIVSDVKIPPLEIPLIETLDARVESFGFPEVGGEFDSRKLLALAPLLLFLGHEGDSHPSVVTVIPKSVPEPQSVLLLLTGVGVLGWWRCKR